MIRTEKYSLTESKYFRIILRIYFTQRIWFWSILLIGFISGIIFGDLFLIIFPVVWLLYVVTHYWHYAYSKKNKIFFKEHYIEIDGDFLIAYLDDGTTDKINLSNIIELRKNKEYFLLYIAKNQHIYVPFTCFKSEEDIIEFEKVINSHISKI